MATVCLNTPDYEITVRYLGRRIATARYLVAAFLSSAALPIALGAALTIPPLSRALVLGTGLFEVLAGAAYMAISARNGGRLTALEVQAVLNGQGMPTSAD